MPSDHERWSACLERHGWTRAVAGETDFDAAVTACCRMADTGKGLLVSGEYGVGKTALARVVAARGTRAPLFSVRLGIPDEAEKLTRAYQAYYAVDPLTHHVFLDDLGAESLVNEYGARIDRVTEFLLRWYARHAPGRRLIATTNLSEGEFDARYGGRLLSRLRDLCVPLRLTGPDKRQWSLPNDAKDALSGPFSPKNSQMSDSFCFRGTDLH